MADTYKALQTVTVGAGGAASISFSNIPQTYTDLVLRLSLRDNRTGSVIDGAVLRFNNDTNAANYVGMRVQGSGSATSTSTNNITIFQNTSDSTANTFGNTEVYIANYASQTTKAYNSDTIQETDATASFLALIAGSYAGATGISSIQITPELGTAFAQNSTVTVYGVFNADVSTAAAIPTIGTATATGTTTASVAFTPVANAATYTAISTPGSLTATGTTTPITVTGLTPATAYTFKVRSNNPFGSSGESAASNSMTTLTPVYDSIATITTSGGESSISFNSISSGYKHLQIRMSNIRYTADQLIKITFNSNTGANYSRHLFWGNGSTVNSVGGGNQNNIPALYVVNNSGSTTQPLSAIMDVLDYANTSKNKTVSIVWGADFNGSGTAALESGAFLSTNAITSIQFAPFSTNFFAGCTFALYGIL